ncbi:hypothetical protein N9J72_02630 [Candidatus Gracilibacteria bacterium]|nr:hypothetical protein [Candidatus Gracilibacteria bacterium]
MTIIRTNQELQEKILRANTDIAIGRTHSLKEVYEKIANFRKNKNVCTK